ncbi:MAG TPA: GNAT family N-acetyltransferase [Pyrinomonadaceae bacterium]|jgi:RimJ/RimL family protein N-acetyltransferase
MKRLKTERLVLKAYTEADKDDLIALFTDPDVMKYVGDGVMTAAQAEEWWGKLFNKFYPQGIDVWAVFTSENNVYIGHAGIYPRPTKKEDWEFVYFLRRDAWGKGYATEIASALIEYGFYELKLPEVFTSVDNDHRSSIRVMEKAGMKFLRFEHDDEGSYSIYSIKPQ